MSSMGSIGRMDASLSNDMGISSGNTFGGGSGFGITSEVDNFSSKPKGWYLFSFVLLIRYAKIASSLQKSG